MTALQNFVNGQFADATSDAVSDVVDPSTGETYAIAPVSGSADVDAALRRRRRVRDLAGRHVGRAEPRTAWPATPRWSGASRLASAPR
ncbi:MAG TPA: hypothetical protein VEM58_10125 [Streptosporangiaceae bacterium]|nr:hypothetical protein [Streptosporangiaceae bacterium]